VTFDDPSVQQYLSTKDIVILGTINPDGAPLVTAMWFLHDPSALTLISMDGLQKVHNLRRDPRLHILAESGARGADIKGVAIRGRAEFLGDSPERRALATRFLDKYHPHLERYWGGRAMPADRVMFRVVPQQVRTWGPD
jgi:PPOX class probable F420-dependent enzyme